MNKAKILCSPALTAALPAVSINNADQAKASFTRLDAETEKEAGQRKDQAVSYRLPPLLSMTALYQAADSFGMRAMVW